MSKRAKIIAANWKMNHGPATAARFLERFLPSLHVAGFDPGGAAISWTARLLIFPPDLSLQASIRAAHQPPMRMPVEFGVQNIYWEEAGAFTGESSAEIAREAGARFALIGHSERRHIFGESDTDTNYKVQAANRAGLIPVLCVGELLEERREGQLEEVIRRQIGACVKSLADGPSFMIAYEPVWAIGTGETATPEDAAEAHAIVRATLVDHATGDPATTPVLYGGSVKPNNATELMSAPGVDGVLVGGASLEPESLAEIAKGGAAAA